MKSIKLYSFLASILILAYSSPCLAGKVFNDEEFTVFTKKIEYRFEDRDLLSHAFTHSSISRKEGDVDHFQRLEHLGDKVLNLAITDHLYEKHPQQNEGFLAEESKKLISNSHVLRVAKHLDLLSYVMYKVDLSNREQGLEKISYTACEALIGAIYKDGGMDCARKFICSHFLLEEKEKLTDNKKIEQEPIAAIKFLSMLEKKVEPLPVNQVLNYTNSLLSQNNKTEIKPEISEKKEVIFPVVHNPSASLTIGQSFNNLQEFRKLCQYKITTPLQYFESTIKVGDKSFTAAGSSKKKAKQLAAKTAYETLTNSGIGKKNTYQKFKKKFPQSIEEPILTKQNGELELEASYGAYSVKGRADFQKKAKMLTSAKLYEHCKNLEKITDQWL